MGRKKERAKGGVCTRCGKKHPKGKKKRAKLKAAGIWGGCTPKIKKETQSAESRFADPQKREAKCLRTRERNEERKIQRIKEANKRQAEWKKLSDEQKLEILRNRPGNCAKQIAKIEERLNT